MWCAVSNNVLHTCVYFSLFHVSCDVKVYTIGWQRCKGSRNSEIPSCAKSPLNRSKLPCMKVEGVIHSFGVATQAGLLNLLDFCWQSSPCWWGVFKQRRLGFAGSWCGCVFQWKMLPYPIASACAQAWIFWTGLFWDLLVGRVHVCCGAPVACVCVSEKTNAEAKLSDLNLFPCAVKFNVHTHCRYMCTKI